MPESNGTELPILLPTPNRRSRKQYQTGRGRIRAAVLIGVHVVILAHITYFYSAGQALSPVEPSEAMYTLNHGHVNAGVIFFGFAILGTAIFGRFFCGWGCHLVALQDWCSHLLQKFGMRPKPLRSRLLAVVPFALAFYMFVWPTLFRLVVGDPHPGFTNHLVTDSFWQTFPGPVVSVLTFLVCGGLIVYLLGNKGFCTYACPYGAFFSVADQVAGGRIRVTNDCHQCGKCTAACTSNVFVSAEVHDFGMVVDSGCMKCLDCVTACPNDALYFGFTDRDGTSKREKQKETKRSRKKKYDFTWSEEVVGLVITGATVFALRGLYDITPLLLSVGLGVITAYLAIQFWRMFHRRDLRLQRIQLKRNRRITSAGKWVLAALCVWFAFNLHSFAVQYFRYQGRLNFTALDISWNEVVEGEPADRFEVEDHQTMQRGVRNFELSDQLGLKDVMEVKLGLAVANIVNKNPEAAEVYLRQAYACQPRAVRPMLTRFLEDQGRYEEAAAVK